MQLLVLIGLNLEQGQIGLLVAAQYLSLVLSLIIEDNGDRLGAVDHVEVSYDLSVGGND